MRIKMCSQSFCQSAGIEPASWTQVTHDDGLIPTTMAEYHSPIEIFIEFDEYFNSQVVLGDRHKDVLWSYQEAVSISADWEKECDES